jgi:hypothetical protein
MNLGQKFGAKFQACRFADCRPNDKEGDEEEE